MPEPRPVTASRGVSVMIYGVPGAGKTRLIGTGPRTLILRPPTDHTDSIASGADVEELVVDDWASMFEVFQSLQQGELEYEWVWLDSISLFQDHGLDDVFADAVARKPARAEYGPDKGEYGINMQRIGKLVRDMVGLASAGQFNFGLTAHPFEWWDPIQETDVWAPWIQGSNMSPKLCGYMNIVAVLQEVRRRDSDGDQPSQRLLLVDAPGHVGKDQLGCFPALKSGRHGFIDPTMGDVIEAIEASRKPRRKTAAKRRARRTQ